MNTLHTLRETADGTAARENALNAFAAALFAYVKNISVVSYKNNRLMESLKEYDSDIRVQVIDDVCMKLFAKTDRLYEMADAEIFMYIRTACNNHIKDVAKSGYRWIDRHDLVMDETNEDGSAKVQFEDSANIAQHAEQKAAVANAFALMAEKLGVLETVSLISEFENYKPRELAALLMEGGERTALLTLLDNVREEYTYVDLTAFQATVLAAKCNRADYEAYDVTTLASKISHARNNAKMKLRAAA